MRSITFAILSLVFMGYAYAQNLSCKIALLDTFGVTVSGKVSKLNLPSDDFIFYNNTLLYLVKNNFNKIDDTINTKVIIYSVFSDDITCDTLIMRYNKSNKMEFVYAESNYHLDTDSLKYDNNINYLLSYLFFKRTTLFGCAWNESVLAYSDYNSCIYLLNRDGLRSFQLNSRGELLNILSPIIFDNETVGFILNRGGDFNFFKSNELVLYDLAKRRIKFRKKTYGLYKIKFDGVSNFLLGFTTPEYYANKYNYLDYYEFNYYTQNVRFIGRALDATYVFPYKINNQENNINKDNNEED